MKQSRVFLAFLFAALFSINSQAAVSVSTKLGRTDLKVGDSFTFTLRFEGLPSPIPQPFLPQIDGAAVKGQYQSAEPGRNGQAYLYHYIISPVRSGRIHLADFTVRVESQSLKVSGFTIEAGESPAPASSPKTTATAPSRDEIFLEGRLAKADAFLGEAVVYTLHLLTRESIRNFEFVQKSEFDGFRKIELPSSRYPPTSKVTRSGKIFLDATVLKCVLYPLKTGTIAISPFQADIKVQGRGESANPLIRLKGGESSLRVASLPDPPQDFRGAIGVFTSEYLAPLPLTGSVGEPLTIDIAVRGEGSLPAEPFPPAKSPFFSSYPSNYEDRPADSGEITAVDRVYHLSMVPMVAGARELPEMNLVFFDPVSKQYRRSGLKKLSVTVSEGAKSSGRPIPKILPLLPVGSDFTRKSRVGAGSAVWILFAPFLFALSVFAVSEFLERFFLSPEKKRMRLLTSRAVKEFRSARSHLDARKSKIFHNHLKKSLEAVLEIKTGQPISSFTIGELRGKLKENGVDATETDLLAGFSEEIDSAAFSNETPQKTELRKKLDRMRDLIKKRKKKTAVFSLMFLLSMITLAGGQSSILTSRAADEYGKRNFAEAIKYYRIVEASGVVSPELCYNIGNSYFESGEISRAILYYKKALKMNPYMREARNNLATARSLVPAKASPYEPSPLESFLLSRSPDIFFYPALALFSLSCLIFSFLRVFNVYFVRTAFLRAALAFLFLGFASAAMFFMAVRIQDNLKEGIAIEPAPVYQNPDPSLKPLATLPEGSEIFVIQSSGGWLKAKWGEGEGWTRSEKIGIP